MQRLVSLVIVALATALAGTAGASQDSVRLPDLGSSAGRLSSPEENRRMGASVLRRMRGADMLLDDALLRQFVNELGYRLVAQSNAERDSEFTFFIMRSEDINAFAMPGGFIGVNAGLIAATRSESELAGVLAHEIAHVTQHHMLRSAENSRIVSPLILLGMVGALLAASQGGADSDQAVPAILASGQGLMAQNQISFTRKDESEADRIGIDTLADAGFDPDGMADFFGRMDRLLRPGTGGINPPQLLLTHPIFTTRISEAKARAHTIEREQRKDDSSQPVVSPAAWEDTVAPVPYLKAGTNLLASTDAENSESGERTEPDHYALMRERTRVLAARDPDALVRYYARNLKDRSGFRSSATEYGYALALIRNHRAEQAIDLLQELHRSAPSNLPFRLALADAQWRSGARDQALTAYAAMLAAVPDSHAIALDYADALLASGKQEDAKRAVKVLEPLLDVEVEEPELYRSFGRANDVAGNQVRAAEAFADATYLSGRPADAMDQLERLLDRDDLSYYQRARIEARIEFLTPIILELRRRGALPEQRAPAD